jgi:hypothetical protein
LHLVYSATSAVLTGPKVRPQQHEDLPDVVVYIKIIALNEETRVVSNEMLKLGWLPDFPRSAPSTQSRFNVRRRRQT